MVMGCDWERQPNSDGCFLGVFFFFSWKRMLRSILPAQPVANCRAVNKLLRFERQTRICQSAHAVETHHSFNCKCYWTVQNHFFFDALLLTKGTRFTMREWEKEKVWDTWALLHVCWTFTSVGYIIGWGIPCPGNMFIVTANSTFPWRNTPFWAIPLGRQNKDTWTQTPCQCQCQCQCQCHCQCPLVERSLAPCRKITCSLQWGGWGWGWWLWGGGNMAARGRKMWARG